MKKTLLAILIFQIITTHINAQENKSEIELDQVELIASPRIEIKNTDNAEELALPPVKIHCSVLAEDAIKTAIADLQEKQEAMGKWQPQK